MCATILLALLFVYSGERTIWRSALSTEKQFRNENKIASRAGPRVNCFPGINADINYPLFRQVYCVLSLLDRN